MNEAIRVDTVSDDYHDHDDHDSASGPLIRRTILVLGLVAAASGLSGPTVRLPAAARPAAYL